ncbi:MAG: DUF1533 domain-containing protein, partial [Tissierellia bacterium]|nr:DUF1533 domain-containing protein [Tissierellia bacterium]
KPGGNNKPGTGTGNNIIPAEDPNKALKDEVQNFIDSIDMEKIEKLASEVGSPTHGIPGKAEGIKNIKDKIARAKELIGKANLTPEEVAELKELKPEKHPKKDKLINGLAEAISHGVVVDWEVQGTRTISNQDGSKKYTELTDDKIVVKSKAINLPDDAYDVYINYVTKDQYAAKDGIDTVTGATPKYEKQKLNQDFYTVSKTNDEFVFTMNTDAPGYDEMIKNAKIMKPIIKAVVADRVKIENGDLVFVKEATAPPVVEKVALSVTGDNITINPVAGSVDKGTEVTVTLAPATDMEVDTFTVGGVDKKADIVDNVYTFTINEDTDVAVTYKKKAFDENNVTAIDITTAPTKTEYIDGQDFDPTGMVVTLTDGNGITKEVISDQLEANGITTAFDENDPTTVNIVKSDNIKTTTTVDVLDLFVNFHLACEDTGCENPYIYNGKYNTAVNTFSDLDRAINFTALEAKAKQEAPVGQKFDGWKIKAVEPAKTYTSAELGELVVVNSEATPLNRIHDTSDPDAIPYYNLEVEPAYSDKVFDPASIQSIEIVAPTGTPTYTEGDTFQPEGVNVKLTDTNGLTKEVAYADFAANNLELKVNEDPVDPALPLQTTHNKLIVSLIDTTQTVAPAELSITVNTKGKTPIITGGGNTYISIDDTHQDSKDWYNALLNGFGTMEGNTEPPSVYEKGTSVNHDPDDRFYFVRDIDTNRIYIKNGPSDEVVTIKVPGFKDMQVVFNDNGTISPKVDTTPDPKPPATGIEPPRNEDLTKIDLFMGEYKYSWGKSGTADNLQDYVDAINEVFVNGISYKSVTGLWGEKQAYIINTGTDKYLSFTEDTDVIKEDNVLVIKAPGYKDLTINFKKDGTIIK